MHALIVNDDGIGARGLRILAETFHAAGHRVTVVAPDRQCSAFGHHITFMKPLFAMKTDWPGMDAQWVDGTPADCVTFGVQQAEEPVDVVVSGINDGTNLGTDVHYSGTVSAAMEAAFIHLPAIAVSAPHGAGEAILQLAADEALSMALRIHKKPLPTGAVLNINVPNCAPDAVQGRVAAPLTFRTYNRSVDKRTHPQGWHYYWCLLQLADGQNAPDSDWDWNERGYITYTVLGWDMTLHGQTKSLLEDA